MKRVIPLLVIAGLLLGVALLVMTALMSRDMGSVEPPERTPTGQALATIAAPTRESTAQPTVTPALRPPILVIPTLLPTGGGAQALPTGADGGEDPDAATEIAAEAQGVAAESSIPVVVRSIESGAVIGAGTLAIYAPQTADLGQSVRVELELRFDTLYVTPTPFGAITPLPRLTSTPRPGAPTPTPREPLFTESGVQIYQRMGARLNCSTAIFVTGCDNAYDPAQVKTIATDRLSWSWFLTPAQGVRGAQSLELVLWTARSNSDGTTDFLDQWSHSVAITFSPPAAFPWIVPAVAAAVVLGGVGAWILLRRPRTARKLDAFISYRRSPNWGHARSIANSLSQRGLNVFLDIDDINEGRFAEVILKAIEEAPYFVLLLSPTTLESTWVQREVAHAIQHQRRIIPLLTDGFRLEEDSLPDDLRVLAGHNAITLTPEFYEEAIDRLAKRFIQGREGE